MPAPVSLPRSSWDAASAARLAVPTHVLGSDPKVYSIFTGDLAAEVLRNPVVTMSVVAGAARGIHPSC